MINFREKKYVVIYLMLACGILWWAMDRLYNKGMKEGMQMYHNACFEMGGFIIDDQGRAITCSPMGLVPKEELQHYKPSLDKVV